MAATAGAVRPHDAALEPSAGTGALAHLARRAGAQLVLNEIDPFRAAFLVAVSGTAVSRHDTEPVDDLLVRRHAAELVVMNPPFAWSASRSADPTVALRLGPGDRLVAVRPRAVCAARRPALRRRLTGIVFPRLNLAPPGAVFRRMGTGVETALLVTDRGMGDTAIPLRPVASLEEALAVIRCEWPPRPGRGAAAPATFPAPLSPRGVATPAARRTTRAVARAAPAPGPRPAAVAPLSCVERTAMSEAVAVSDLYARHEPQRIEIEGAAPHRSPLWERAAMAAVAPPLPAARSLPPPRLAAEGLLSAAQLETIVMAEDAHARELPGRHADSEDWTEAEPVPATETDGAAGAGASDVAYRQGTFLGDGTGAGKGRQVAVLILAGWLAGRTRAVWLSKSRADRGRPA